MSIVIVRRIVLSLLLIPPAIVLVDAILRALDAEDNPLGEVVGAAAEWLTPAPLTRVFEDQGDLLTAALVVGFYLALMVVVAVLFRVVRSLLSR